MLRNFGDVLEGCKGNRYVTTIHVINSAIIKASKLTKIAPVYRGVSGSVLPEELWTPNAHGVRGGVERGFLSLSYDRNMAMEYASDDVKPSILFEIQMGAVDRGCSLEWISQYPHERECLFPPLTGLELIRTRVEGKVLIAEAKLSINLNALTIDKVVGTMRRAHLDLVQLLLNGFAHSRVPECEHGPLLQLIEQSAELTPDWFASSVNFKAATEHAFEAREAVFRALRERAETWDGAVSSATMCAREGRHDVALALLKKAQLGDEYKDDELDLRVARWMVGQELAPPWAATFASLNRPDLVRVLPQKLVQADALEVGTRVLACKDLIWKSAVVTDPQGIDVRVGGWETWIGLSPTEAVRVRHGGTGALLRAASELGCAELVRRLIERGANIFVTDDDATTALHLAAGRGHADICQALVDAGAKKETDDRRRKTALDAAAANRQGDVLRLFSPTDTDRELKELGHDCYNELMHACRRGDYDAAMTALDNCRIDEQSDRGSTALLLAAEAGCEDIVRELCRRGAMTELATLTGETALLAACRQGHHLCIRALIEAEAAVDATNKNGWTALMFACQNGHDLCARALIEAGSEPRYAKGDGWTALMYACQDGHDLCTRALLEARAAVDAIEDDGWTALMFACQNGHDLCARALIEAGAAVDATAEDGWTALMLACQNGHGLCARALIEAGAEVDAHDNTGVTALIKACENGHDLCACALIEAGVAVDAKNKNGSTALMLACQNGHDLCARTLVEAGAAVDAIEEDGWTALMLACQNGHDLCARALIEAGVAVDAQNNYGTTALMWACHIGHDVCARALIEVGADLNKTNSKGWTALTYASQNNHDVCARALIEAGRRVHT